MRKILLASTALVAMTSASAMAIEITGSTNLVYSNDDERATDASQLQNEMDVTISFEATTDSGITTTMAMGFDEDNGGANGTNHDDSSATISGDFGAIKIVVGGADDGYVVSMDEAFNMAGEGTGGTATTLAGSVGDSVSYQFPSVVDGMNVAVQHANEDGSESFGYGVQYDAGMAAVSVARMNTNTTEYSHASISTAVSGLALAVEQNKSTTGATEAESTLYGMSYSLDGATLAYEMGSTKDAAGTKTEDYSQMALSYSVATGITAVFTTSEIDSVAGTDVNETEVQLKLSF